MPFPSLAVGALRPVSIHFKPSPLLNRLFVVNGKYVPESDFLAAWDKFGHGYDPEVLELEKWRNLLAKQQYQTTAPVDDAPGWNEDLASDSEAFVKADRTPGSPSAELVERTVTHVKARHSAEQRLEETGEHYDQNETPRDVQNAGAKTHAADRR